MFSGAVKLAALDDYLAPAQACVKPQMQVAATKTTGKASSRVQIESEFDPGAAARVTANFGQIKANAATQTATITLNDCLACSGCVTSAETVLITQQSGAELLQQLATKAETRRTFVVTVSPQSRAALAHYFGLNALQFAKRLVTFLRRIGVDYVMDSACALDFALIETCEEFVARYLQTASKMTTTSSSAAAAAASAAPVMDGSSTTPASSSSSASALTSSGGGAGSDRRPHLPMLASECPGWVCYAEKTQPADILPLISTTRSPQQIMGALVKRYLGPQLGLKPDQIFHCSIMPCFDKKLEATRDDFKDLETGVRDVDCVLSTSELRELIFAQLPQHLSTPPSLPSSSSSSSSTEESSTPETAVSVSVPHLFASLPESSLDRFSNIDAAQTQLLQARDVSGTGGYLEAVFRHAAFKLFGTTLPAGPLPLKVGRNSDFRELELAVEGKVVLRFASAYGFRNIQNVVRQIKTGKCAYDYVEIMACPAGCLNGGGQIPLRDYPADKLALLTEAVGTSAATVTAVGSSIRTQKLLLQHLDTVYREPVERAPRDAPIVQELYASFAPLASGPFSSGAREFLHTQYHHVEASEFATGLGAKW